MESSFGVGLLARRHLRRILVRRLGRGVSKRMWMAKAIRVVDKIRNAPRTTISVKKAWPGPCSKLVMAKKMTSQWTR